MPVVAQVTGAVALTALIMGPWWSRVTTVPAAAPLYVVPPPAAVAPNSPSSPASPASPASPESPDSLDSRPAHLNLDVRHTFANVDVTVTVDDKKVLDTSLEGSGKKFKMFGRREERSFTRTLDLQPGVRLVRVNVKSADDHFNQTRVERFELGSAAVASLRITADKSGGLVAVADRPSKPAPSQAPAPLAAQPVAAAAIPLPSAAPAAPPNASMTTQQADALAELLSSLRSMLIAIAGFVASAATGFVVQEYLRSKKGALFAGAGAEGEIEIADEEAPAPSKVRRRRRSGSHSPAALE